MIYSRFLKDNNIIVVPAPSDGSYCEQDINRFNNAKKQIEKRGYKVDLSENVFKSNKGRSASAEERAEELNRMFEDQNIDFIWCASGGEFLIEILPYVDFEIFAKNPRWVEGFSDPTGIIFPLTTKYDIATIYGNNFKSFGMQKYDRSLEDNLEIIKGNIIKQNSYEMYENERQEKITGLEGYNYTSKVEWKTLDGGPVNFEGRIFAGCLDIISELAGTKYDGTNSFIEKYKNDGIIWGFDICDLSKEEIIRTLWKLNELGYFKYTNGIIIGRCGNDNSYLDYNMEQCIKDSIISKLKVPIIYDADISHKGPSMTIINGSIAIIECKNGKGSIEFKLI